MGGLCCLVDLLSGGLSFAIGVEEWEGEEGLEREGKSVRIWSRSRDILLSKSCKFSSYGMRKTKEEASGLEDD